MTGESNQVCHACHDPPQILISLQICSLYSSGDNGTDGNWSIIVEPGPGNCDGSKERRVKVIWSVFRPVLWAVGGSEGGSKFPRITH